MERYRRPGSHRVTLPAADGNVAAGCSEVWILADSAGSCLGVDLEHFFIPKASTASLELPLRRSGAEQEEMLALHHAAAQSVEQHIAGANHASLNEARNESHSEATRGAGALPIVRGVAQAPGARLITAARSVLAQGEQRENSWARPARGSLRGAATAAEGAPRIRSRDHGGRWRRHERHQISSADPRR